MLVAKDEVEVIVASLAERWAGHGCRVTDVRDVRTRRDEVSALVVVDAAAGVVLRFDVAGFEARLVRALGARSVRITMRLAAVAAA